MGEYNLKPFGGQSSTLKPLLWHGCPKRLQCSHTLEIQSSRENPIWSCSASHSGNEQKTPRFPKRRTLPNHIVVSAIGGPKALLFYWSYTASPVSWLDPMVWIHHPNFRKKGSRFKNALVFLDHPPVSLQFAVMPSQEKLLRPCAAEQGPCGKGACEGRPGVAHSATCCVPDALQRGPRTLWKSRLPGRV